MPADSPKPDGLLIAAALLGDEAAFAALVLRYRDALTRAAASRLGRRELAEEAVQEAFLCAHRWLSTYDSRYSFRTWLWTILLNQCTRLTRREAKHAAAGEAAERVHRAMDAADRASASPLAQLLARERSEQLHELLARLPVVQADALRLRFFGGLTFPEVAAAMGCSEPGAKQRVKAGLLKLARWMQAGEQSESDARATVQSGQTSQWPDEIGDES